MNLDQLETEANQRIGYFINRSAGQPARAMRASWPKPETPATATEPRPAYQGRIELLGDEPMTHTEAMKLLAWAVSATIVVSMTAGWAYQTFFN